MIGAGFGTGDAVEQGILCATSSLVAQVDTLTATYAASEVYIISITIEGQQYGPVQVTANTDSATTATDIVTAINAMMPANTVLAAATSGGALTLTAEVAGKAFSVSYGVKSGTAARLTLTHTTAGERSDINRCFRGISAHVHNNESTAIGASTPSYPPNSAVKVWTRGEVWVSNSQTPDGDDPVYVETASGSDSGKLYNTTSATRILLDRSVARWRRSGATAADNLAVVQIGA
jgi:hypothetical protein